MITHPFLNFNRIYEIFRKNVCEKFRKEKDVEEKSNLGAHLDFCVLFLYNKKDRSFEGDLFKNEAWYRRFAERRQKHAL